MAVLKVAIDDETVWSLEAEYDSFRQFPAEYLARPAEGSGIVHELSVDGVVIGMQRSFAAEADNYEADAVAEANEAKKARLLALAAAARADSLARIAQGG